MAKLISGKVAQKPSNKPALRIKILFNLFNLLDDGYARYYVYMKALQLAASGKVTEHVIPSFKKVDDFLKEWNVGVQDQRELFLTISNILRESKRRGPFRTGGPPQARQEASTKPEEKEDDGDNWEMSVDQDIPS